MGSGFIWCGQLELSSNPDNRMHVQETPRCGIRNFTLFPGFNLVEVFRRTDRITHRSLFVLLGL